MKKFYPILALLILAAALFLVFKKHEPPSPEKFLRTATTNREKSSRLPILSPKEAHSKIAHIRSQTPNSNTTFDTIQTLVEKLGDNELQSLIKEIGFGKTHGYDHWLRSALIAEWADRDLEAVVSFIRSPNKGGSTYDSSLQQAYFAIFNGSRPDDPETALQHLHTLCSTHKLGNNGTGSNWIEHAHQTLFQELSREDPNKAWDLLPIPHTTDYRQNQKVVKIHRAALQGLFSSLPHNDLISEFADLWADRYFIKYPQLDLQLPVLGRTFTREAQDTTYDHNKNAATIASFWINSDPAAALDWLHSLDPTDSALATDRTSRAFSDWAYRNPKAALTALQNNDFPEFSSPIATNLLRADAHLAPEVIAIPNPTFNLHDAIIGSTTLNSMLEGPAQYPDPHKNNRPPDYEARAESFRTAIQTPGIFNERYQNQLLDSLERDFESIQRISSRE